MYQLRFIKKIKKMRYITKNYFNRIEEENYQIYFD